MLPWPVSASGSLLLLLLVGFSAAAETPRQPLLKPVPSTEPHPFIREVMLLMDNCGGTNKSQFAFGTLAVLLLRGVLDAL